METLTVEQVLAESAEKWRRVRVAQILHIMAEFNISPEELVSQDTPEANIMGKPEIYGTKDHRTA